MSSVTSCKDDQALVHIVSSYRERIKGCTPTTCSFVDGDTTAQKAEKVRSWLKNSREKEQQEFCLNDLKLECLPTEISQFFHITSLDLRRNLLKSFELTGMQSLQYLCLLCCQLESVRLENMPNLQTLDLSHNLLKEVDLDLPSLENLSLSNNRFTTIALTNRAALRKLSLHCNPLEKVSLSHMPALEDLSLDTTDVREIYLKDIPLLKELYLTGDQLQVIEVEDVPTFDMLSVPPKQRMVILAKHADDPVMSQIVKAIFTWQADCYGELSELNALINAPPSEVYRTIQSDVYIDTTFSTSYDHKSQESVRTLFYQKAPHLPRTYNGWMRQDLFTFYQALGEKLREAQ